MEYFQRIGIFFSLICFTLSLALSLTSFLSDFWIEADFLEKVYFLENNIKF